MQNQEIEISINSKDSFVARFYQYQKERFPILVHGLLIACFTFSAIAYSRLSRGVDGFVDLSSYAVAVFVTVTLFFLLRLFDEVKDYEDDILYRKYLPVPRGLISLTEVKYMIKFVILIQILILAFTKPILLPIYGMCLGYILLMRVEFFVPNWLRERQVWYILSHMMIIPLVDIFASAADWKLNNAIPSNGLMFFFVVSFLNGLVLEVGRKIRTPNTEEQGVVSYTKMWGVNGAILRWIGLLLLTLFTAIAAANYAGHEAIIFILLGIVFLMCSIPALMFLNNPSKKLSKLIEHASGVWTLFMYLLLGAGPMLVEIL